MSTTATAFRSWTRIRIWSGHCREHVDRGDRVQRLDPLGDGGEVDTGQGLAGGYVGRGHHLLVAEHPGALDVHALDRERGGEKKNSQTVPTSSASTVPITTIRRQASQRRARWRRANRLRETSVTSSRSSVRVSVTPAPPTARGPAGRAW